MMKKLLLMSAAGCLAALSSNAQMLKQPIQNNNAVLNAGTVNVKFAAPESYKKSTAKTTAPGTREYDHAGYLASISNISIDSLSAARIWSDSTIKQSFSTGEGKVNFSSVAQVIFPYDTVFNDPTNPNFLGQMRITRTTPYRIDSVKIQGIYLTGTLRSTTIVDTLIISLGQQGWSYNAYSKTALAADGIDITPYLVAADNDTLRLVRPFGVDPVTRSITSNGTGAPARVLWKLPLTSAMRSPIATAPIINIVQAPPGGPYAISAGNVPVLSYTFKSGDTWVPDVSNIDSFHRFLPIFIGTNKVMPVKGRYVVEGDHSSSALMFSTAPTYYLASTIIEAINFPEYDYEYLSAQMVMSCPTCGLVEEPGTSIKESSLISSVSAFPNPANSTLNVPFTTAEKANVTVRISNMVGQVIATQDMGTLNAGQKATATFNTSNLANGVYMYTVEANGQHVSNRFSVTH